MNSMHLRCMAAAALLTLPVAGRAEIACPDTLSVDQRADPPSGWSVAYGEQAPRLSGVTIFDGQPANRVSIKYNHRRQNDKESILSWDLGTNPRSFYLQCSYERTTAQIATALPPGVRTCEVVQDRTVSYPGGGFAIKRMVCR
ncbi:MAG TPA: STY0301 family protein [Burkholderiales bacterium]|nr:STY0301 family protein [Burkholderiales bacterium]